MKKYIRDVLVLFVLVVYCANNVVDASCSLPGTGCTCSGDYEYVNCNNRGLKTLPKGLPSYTVKLYLSGNQINISEGMFSGFSKLQLLDLSQNQLTYIPQGLFRDLASLKSLQLNKNGLSDASLTSETFQGLYNLTTLGLSSNNISGHFKKDAFQYLKKLDSLSLAKNDLTYLTSETFNSLSNLPITYLGLYGNKISGFDKNAFQNLKKLEYIDLRTNDFTDLPLGIFRNLVNLQRLYVYEGNLRCSCNLYHTIVDLKKQGNGTIEIQGSCNNGDKERFDVEWYIPKQTCSPAKEEDPKDRGDDDCPSMCSCGKSVEYDYFVNCADKGLKTLPNGIPSYTASLQLSGNQIKIWDGMFSGLTNLRYLALDRNGITYLSKGGFRGLSKLSNLGLCCNALTNLTSGSFYGLSKLEGLDLGNNQISAFDKDAFQYLYNLRGLYLKNNRFTELPVGIFQDLVNLGNLEIYDNRNLRCSCNLYDVISKLKKKGDHVRIDGTCDNGNDERYKVQVFTPAPKQMCSPAEDRPVNGCPSMCTCSGSHEKFTVDCSKRGLRSIPRVPSYTDRFWVNQNELAVIPKGIFKELNNLRLLVLGGNRFTYIPNGAFSDLNNLQFLAITENRLTSLPDGIFDGMDKLLQLSLQFNKITYLPDSIFKRLKNLQYLNLANNGLNIFPNVYGLQNLVTLDLTNNPFTCSCHLFNQIHLLKQANRRIRMKGTCNGNINLDDDIHKQRCDDRERDHEERIDDKFSKANFIEISLGLIFAAVTASCLV